LEKSYWDIIVIDEAHNVAVRGSKSARAKLAELLGTRSDTMILASATPHDGRAESFASLMNMLNPTAIANPKKYGPEDIEGLFLRRFKKDVQEQIGKAFLDRKTHRWPKPASVVEEQAFESLTKASFVSFEKAQRTGQLLFRTVLEKALFSSPAACGKTIEQRLTKIKDVQTPEAARDRETLKALADAVAAITPQHFSKYQNLLALLRKDGALDWHPERTDDRLVIFTERVETLKFLRERLAEDLKLKPGQIETLYGQDTDDKKLQDTVEKFGREKEAVRLLIATDIAAEGLNLHFLAHKLIHFDIPWSLMVFQQRNGRIDRYGQEKQPIISYLCTESQNPKIHGDQRILQLLSEKDEQAQKNIGDPSAFQGVYDQALEEIETGKAIEKSLSVDEYDKQLQQTAKAADVLAILMGTAPPPKGETAPASERSMSSLYASDLDYMAAGLAADERVQFDVDKDRQMVNLTLPRDLERTLKRTVPKGSLPEDGRLHLTMHRQLVQEEIRRTRAGEQLWPHVHLLWDLHPAVEWLNYKLLVNFDRAQAPVVTLKGVLNPQEIVFLMQGEIPNRKGQPVVHRWFGVRFDTGVFAGIEEMPALLERTGFHRKEFANPALPPDILQTKTLLPEAVQHARQYMSQRRAELNAELAPKLESERQKLEKLQIAKKQQLDMDFGDGGLAAVRLRQKQAKERKIDAIFADWTAYVQDTLTTEDAAFLRVAAVFRGE
jgi:superfamily II DNA/RNA helicase